MLVSPQRELRPWHGAVEAAHVDRPAARDPDCYLCPGGRRASGKRTPEYERTYVFDNDFPALLPEAAPRPDAVRLAQVGDRDGLLVAEPDRGICRVVCYSPRHDANLADLTAPQAREVVDTWAAQYLELGAVEWVSSVQVFENRGAMMGASNPHPHGQIWAEERVPELPARELLQQREYAADGRCLLCDYAAVESARQDRVVLEDEGFLVVVPFWAVWPFETLVLPRAHCGALPDVDADGRDRMARVLLRLTSLYDRLFGVVFPYSMGLHQRPTDGGRYPEWHLHAHFYPPLLRSAAVRKFLVGYELLAQPQRDLTPEAAAARLRRIAEP